MTNTGKTASSIEVAEWKKDFYSCADELLEARKECDAKDAKIAELEKALKHLAIIVGVLTKQK